MTRFFISLYRYFSAHKGVFYAILIGSTLIFGFFATRLHFEENILSLLPKTEKSKECSVAFANVKLKDKVFLTLSSRSGETSPQELSASMQEFIETMNRRDEGGLVQNTLYRIDTDDIMNVVYYAMEALPCHLGEGFYSLLDSLGNEETIDRIVSGEQTLDISQMSSYTMVDGFLFSPDTTLAIAYVTPSFNAMDSKSGNKLEALLSASVKEFHQEHPDIDVLYHGTTIESCFNSLRIKKDLVWTVGISLLLICLLIFVCFRSRCTLLHLLMPVAYGILFALATVYWIKGTMSFIAFGICAIVMGVALSYCLHVLTHYKYVNDVETVIREQARPVCLGCLTTVGAFAGLLFTTSPLLRDFGIFASLALIGNTFFALAFLPQFFTSRDAGRNERIFALIDKINSYRLDRNVPAVVALTAVIVVGCIFSGRVKFDSNLSNIGYREPKVVLSEQLLNSKLGNSDCSWYYAAHAADLDSAIHYSRAMTRVLDSLRQTGDIFGYSGVEGIFVPYEEQMENIARWKEYWTPSKVEEAYRLLKREDEKYSLSQGAGMDIPETFKLMAEADFEPQSIYDAGVIPDALLCNLVEQNEDGWLAFTTVMFDRSNMFHVNDVLTACDHIVVMDPFYYAGDMVKLIHDDFSVVLLISSLFVLLVLLLSFRSLVVSLIAFLPMMLSWYVVQGLMALFGLEFNLVNIMISTFVFGIGVDYSIFVMEGLIGDEMGGGSRLLLYHKSAIFFSAFTLIVVTGSLVFASHPAIHSIGATTIIGMVTTILISYTLQPLLFRWAMKVPRLRERAIRSRQE